MFLFFILKFVITNLFKNKILSIFIGSLFIFGFFLVFTNKVYAIDTYQPLETITIGEFIYNDDYTPTADDCTISIYNPVTLDPEVNDATMTDEGTVAVTGWHYYIWTTPATEGKYPAMITCGSSSAGNLFKLDKTFIVKAPVVTNSSIASAVDTNTSATVSSAVTTINGNTNTQTSSLATTLSGLPATIWGYSTRTMTAFGALAADVWNNTYAPTRSLSTFGTLVADVWSNTTRSLTTSGGITASDVWSYGTRNLTDGTLSTGSLAKVSDLGGLATATNVTNATSGLATTAQLTTAISPLATSAMLALVKTNTDTINWTDITSIKGNVATLITEVGTGNITAIKTKTDSIAWNDVTGLVTSNGLIKAKTDNIAWADVTGIKTKTDTIAWNDVTGIKTKTDTILWTDIAALAKATDLTTATSGLATTAQLNSAVSPLAKTADVTSSTGTITGAIANIPSNVWNYTTRSLSTLGTLASDIWNASTRTLTSLTLSSQSPWTVSTSDFGTITAGSNYLATVTTIYNGTLTDSANVPTVTIYDPSRNVIANNMAMTRTSVGTYTYSYTTPGNAPAGTWESVFSATVETGKTLPGNDYWTVVTTPAQVIINSISNTITPNISANVTITNEGLSGNEYQYEWCVVSSIDNPCGGGDDIFHAVAAKYINSQEDFNTTLTATVPNAGDYYFKMIVYFGTESSGASRSFKATSKIIPSGGVGGGGGGGGGSTSISVIKPTVDVSKCSKANFNCDGKVDSIDFSILLYFWKSKPPFKNEYVDINKDGKVDSIDFSILLYQWGK